MNQTRKHNVSGISQNISPSQLQYPGPNKYGGNITINNPTTNVKPPIHPIHPIHPIINTQSNSVSQQMNSISNPSNINPSLSQTLNSNPNIQQNSTLQEKLKKISEMKQLKELKEKIETANKPKNLKYLKRKKTLRRTYKVGKSKVHPKVSVLISNKTIRKNINTKAQLLKQTSINEIKRYLINNGFIKVGSTAPNDVLRKMYESIVMTGGQIKNHNLDNLLYNYLNDNQ